MEDETIREFEIFKEAIREENLEIQIEITKRLGSLAKHLGEEITRNELLPFIKENIDFHDEILLNLSDQLTQFIPLVGGYEHSQPILELLVKLCNTDEAIVRDKTVETLKNIAENLNDELTEKLFLPVVEALTNEDWFTSKCSAAALYATIYPKIRAEKQIDLRNSFRVLIQDDSPIVRRAAVMSLLDLIPILSKECLNNEFLPVFDNIAKDSMDSVRAYAVDIACALAKRLTENEIEEFIFKTVESWPDDFSWKIRQRLAASIANVQSAIPQNKFRGKILLIFQKLAKDLEVEIRIITAKNIFDYTLNLRKTYEDQPKLQENFEPIFQQSILPQIRLLISDQHEEVRLAVCSNVLSLSSLLSEESFRQCILPLVVEVFETEISMTVQASLLQTLNQLPANVDLTKSLHSIKNVVRSLIINSQSHWRTRRNLLVAFMHIAKFARKEYFSENLKIYYAALLGDPVFAVRRTAPLILPLLAKQYGMEWTTENIIPYFMMFTKDARYLYRYVPLFGIKELLRPSLDLEETTLYLKDLKLFIDSSTSEAKKISIKILARIVKILNKIKEKLNEQTCIDVLSLNKSIDDFKSDNINLYAGETLQVLKVSSPCNIFSLEETSITEEFCPYLEGLLVLIYKKFLRLVLELFDDPIVNVQIRSIFILNQIKIFTDEVTKELEEPWVQEAIKLLSKAESENIDRQVEDALAKTSLPIEEETVDTELADGASSEAKTEIVHIIDSEREGSDESWSKSKQQIVPKIKVETVDENSETATTEQRRDDDSKDDKIESENKITTDDDSKK